MNCPLGRDGYPVYVYNTFMDGNCTSDGYVIISGMQNGMGIISYLKWWEYTGRTNNRVLEFAKLMGDCTATVKPTNSL
jgi:hypothetical protein